MSIGNSKAAALNKHSMFSNRKSPVLKNLKKVGIPVYKRRKPPLHEKPVVENNVSSLPVIVNSLSISPNNSSDSKSPANVKRYELKGRVIKPEQRLAQLRRRNKVSIFLNGLTITTLK